MSGSAPEDQPDWEKFIADCNWDAVDNWWRDCFLDHPEQKKPLRALLDRLMDIVPKITIQNGMEKTERHILHSDDESHWRGRETLKGAAAILELGELAAAVEGDPPTATETWRDHVKPMEDKLRRYLAEPEVTEGSQELSRKTHAQNALDHIKDIEDLIAVMCSELDEEEGRGWLEEIMFEAALHALDAGRHLQQSWNKDFEPFVPTGMKIASAQKEGARVRREQTSLESRRTLAEMDRLVAVGISVSRAAELSFEKGFGSSKSANRKLFQRCRK